MRARQRAGRRCAQPSERAPPSVRELLASVEVDEAEPELETPDIFEPNPEDDLKEEDLEFEPQAPRRMHSPLARALAVAVDVEAACEAEDDLKRELVSPAAPAQVVEVTPTQTRFIANALTRKRPHRNRARRKRCRPNALAANPRA